MKAASEAKKELRAAVAGTKPLRVGKVDVFPSTGEITGRAGHRQLDPKVLQVLLRLAAANGEVVSKRLLMEDVWPGVVVTDFAVSRCIYQLRKNLCRAAGISDSPIETLPKRGYRLVWPISECNDSLRAPVRPARVRSVHLLAGTAILALVLLAVWLVGNRAGGPMPHHGIAIMPFDDLSPSGDMGYFAEGFAAVLRAELGQIQEFDVIAKTSSSYFQDRQVSTSEIGKALDADYLVEGDVSKEGNELQVTAALVEAANGRQVWSKIFTARTDALFTAQQSIAEEIAAYFDLSLGNPHAHGGTTSLEAFEAFLHAYDTGVPDQIDFYADLALAHDPDYANAMVAKAMAIYLRLWHGEGAPESSWAEAKPLLDRALEISDELADAYVLVGGFAMWREDYQAAETALMKALQINPNNPFAYAHLSRLMERTGRLQEAVSIAERNVRLDPMNSLRHVQLANRLWTAGDYPGGKASFERALELSPVDYGAWRNYALRLANLKGVMAGIRLVARMQRNPEFRALFTVPDQRVGAGGVQLFVLWFNFIEDYGLEREMLELQSRLGKGSYLHREWGWLYLAEGDLDAARREAWLTIEGMPREDVANSLLADVALRSGRDLDRVLDHLRRYWPELVQAAPDVSTAPPRVAIAAALIQQRLGSGDAARRLLEALLGRADLQDDGRAMAEAHLGNIPAALDALEQHVQKDGYFSYVDGNPFWAPLVGEPRFTAVVEAEAEKDAEARRQVNALVESGELTLPGRLPQAGSATSAAGTK